MSAWTSVLELRLLHQAVTPELGCDHLCRLKVEAWLFSKGRQDTCYQRKEKEQKKMWSSADSLQQRGR